MAADRFRVADWLKTHDAAERSFAKALRKFFSEQADRIAETIRENFPGALPSPSQVPLIFDANAEHEKLWPIVRRNLSGLLVVGARAEQRAVQRRLEGKAYEDDLADLDLPEITRAGLQRALSELESQDYWRAIQQQTDASLTGIIQQAIDDKASGYELGIRIRNELGGFSANKRAQRISRTETTGCLNAGHEAFAASLVDDQIITGKEWNAIADDDCRESHAALNGTVVPARGNFIVGRSPAPHPGHWSLPAKERINCRCTVLSVLAEEYMPNGADEQTPAAGSEQSGLSGDANGGNVDEHVIVAT